MNSVETLTRQMYIHANDVRAQIRPWFISIGSLPYYGRLSSPRLLAVFVRMNTHTDPLDTQKILAYCTD